jgi:integrase
MAALRAALNQAMHDGFTTTDFAWQRELVAVPGATGRRDAYLSQTEIDALMANLNDDAKPFFKALCLIPLRPGALAQATVGDFNKALGVLSITKDKTKKIQIALPPMTREFFAAQCVNKLPGALLFTRGDGIAWDKDTWQKPFNKAAKLAALPAQACTYSLRHAGITNMIQAGIDVLTVALISNTSVRMIEATYGHLTASHSVNALQVLAR